MAPFPALATVAFLAVSKENRKARLRRAPVLLPERCSVLVQVFLPVLALVGWTSAAGCHGRLEPKWASIVSPETSRLAVLRDKNLERAAKVGLWTAPGRGGRVEPKRSADCSP